MDATRQINTEDEARQYATDWQRWASEQNLSYGELWEWQQVFTKMADKFGLREEFEENAII